MTFFIIYISLFILSLFLAERNSNKSNSCCSGNSQDSNNSFKVSPCGCLCGRVQMGVEYISFERKNFNGFKSVMEVK